MDDGDNPVVRSEAACPFCNGRRWRMYHVREAQAYRFYSLPPIVDYKYPEILTAEADECGRCRAVVSGPIHVFC